MRKLLAVLPALIACLIFVGTLCITSCAHQAPAKEGGAQAADGIPREAVLAFNGAYTAWALLDEAERDRLKAINDAGDPAKAKAALEKARARNAQLHRLRDALELTRKWLAGEAGEQDGRAALRSGALLLQLLVEEMRADGLAIPGEVDVGLKAAALLL